MKGNPNAGESNATLLPMDYLWTPWRYAYVSTADKVEGCLFCHTRAANNDRKAMILHRGEFCLVMLNAFPYSSGHVLIAPYAHVDQLDKLEPAACAEMMILMQRMESVFRQVYQPDGINFGMNLGRAAGAGIAGHIHMHGLPRWFGDTSFITSVAETRVVPEALETTWEKLRAGLGLQQMGI
jgi:ATP adenylyltransferase